jgi:hypothetical protein
VQLAAARAFTTFVVTIPKEQRAHFAVLVPVVLQVRQCVFLCGLCVCVYLSLSLCNETSASTLTTVQVVVTCLEKNKIEGAQACLETLIDLADMESKFFRSVLVPVSENMVKVRLVFLFL